MEPAGGRSWLSGTGVAVGWLVSVFAAAPAAYFLGIWFSGWEEPPDYIVQGASLSPLYSGAGTAVVMTFVALVGLATVVWGWVGVRGFRQREADYARSLNREGVAP